jgi:hypothetical protein
LVVVVVRVRCTTTARSSPGSVSVDRDRPGSRASVLSFEHPAEHVVRVLGERPGQDQPTQRREWEQAAQAIETYRITHQIDPTEPTALGPIPGVWDQRHDWQAAGTQVLEAREHLGIDKHGHGPPEQRLADIDGLIPERDRERAHDRGHGWER